MTAATPAQAAAHAFVTGCVKRGITASQAAVPPEGQLATVRGLWADVAQAGHEAITAQEPHAAVGIPLRSDAETAAMLRADLADAEAQLARWPKCPAGCSCRTGIEDDPDRNECGCDGPCNGGEQPAPELAAERDGLRKALRAISLGIAEPSPKTVADNALDGRYFDPETDAGVWSMSDPAEQVRLARQDRDQLRKAVLGLAAKWSDESYAAHGGYADALSECASELRQVAEPA